MLSTHYTVHLYLSDSWAEMEEGADARDGPGPDDLVGGATMFLSHDDNRRVDVNPKNGRVLIFQHDGLYHGGDEVKQGIKLTMRTGGFPLYMFQRLNANYRVDIMYRLCRET